MSLNKILSLYAVIVCLKFVLSSPIPVPENVITQLVEVEAVSPIEVVSIESNPNNLPIRIARHLHNHRICHRCGGGHRGYRGGSTNGAQSFGTASAGSGGGGYGGYNGGGNSGTQSFAQSSAGSRGLGGITQSQAQSQSQSANINFGPFSASISSSSSSASSASRG